MRKRDILQLIVFLVFSAIIWTVVAAVLVQQGFFWASLIPVFLFGLTVRNQLKYYRVNSIDVRDADRAAGNDSMKVILGVVALYTLFGLSQFYFEFPVKYVEWGFFALPVLYFSYFFWRVRSLRHKARQEAKAIDAQGTDL